MMNHLHQEILKLIQKNSGKPTQYTFLDSYLGNDHKRYPISAPTPRVIAKDWMRAHRDLTPDEFAAILTSLIEGESSTEKMMAGILMGYSTKEQRKFNPELFDCGSITSWAGRKWMQFAPAPRLFCSFPVEQDQG